MKPGLLIGIGGLLILGIILSGPWGMMGSYGYGGYGMMGSGMFLYGLVYFVFLITLGSFIFAAVFKMIWKSDNDALEISKSRYAKGEISKEEFEEKKKELVK